MTTREDLQLSLDAYDAKVAKAIAKFPERQHLSEKRLYTPLDIDENLIITVNSAFPVSIPSPVAYSPQCTEAACGLCVLMQALPLPKKQMPVTNICCRQAKPVFP